MIFVISFSGLISEEHTYLNKTIIYRAGLDVSLTTVRKRLREGGLFHHIPARKEELTPNNIINRRSFCESHRLEQKNNQKQLRNAIIYLPCSQGYGEGQIIGYSMVGVERVK